MKTEKNMVLDNFIVFEGIDGAGTTTQLNILKEKPECKNFLFTAEPTVSPTGKILRNILKGEIKVKNETAAYFFAADRNEHINGELKTENSMLVTGVKEACSKGKIVISDRYFFSSLAYQSTGCSPEIPRVLNSLFPLPKLLFYFEITPEVSLSRISSRNVREIYEKVDFLKVTVEEYHKVLEEYSHPDKNQGMKIVKLDATKPKEEIASLIWNEIQAVYKNSL